MSGEAQGSKLDTMEKLTKIASSLSVILGVVIALVGIYSAINETTRAMKSLKLTTLVHIEKLIDDDSRFRPKIGNFLKAYDSNKLMGLLQKYDTGEQAYLSDDLVDFREVGRHYDLMGALIKLGYLDFDLIFAVIPFPDDFWNETATFREEVKTNNWSASGGLSAFWENFEYLRQRYEQSREADRQRKADLD